MWILASQGLTPIETATNVGGNGPIYNGAMDRPVRNPDILFWGTIPVISDTTPGYEEYKKWHTAQVQQAIDAVSKSHPNATVILPSDGFHIDALRGGYPSRGQPKSSGELRSVLVVMEDSDYVVSPMPHREMKIAGVLHCGKFADWRTEHNPFIEMFVQIAESLPEDWANWLKWRRRQRTKPIPGWLLEIRQGHKRRSKV
jgi:hypothetical protein